MQIFVIITTIIAGISFAIAALGIIIGGTFPNEQKLSNHYLQIISYLLAGIFLLLVQGPIKIIFG